MTARLFARRREGAALCLARDDRGGATVEFVLWLPILIAMLMVIADLSLMLAGNASMQSAARDTARALARGLIAAEEAEAHLRGQLPVGEAADYVVSLIPGADVVVEVSVPSGALDVFGVFDVLAVGDFATRAVVRRETP